MPPHPATAVAKPSASNPAARDAAATRQSRWPVERSASAFYLWAGLAVALVVVIGFGRTVETKLLHPPSSRPPVLYLHVAVSTAWVLLFIVQSALIRLRRTVWHRRLGLAGAGLGALLPVVGIATALAMARLHRAEGANHPASLIVPLYDMSAFTVMFGLAILWRQRPDYHRRAMLIATFGLTAAAFARFPEWLVPNHAWYPCADLLILAAALRDRIVVRQVHPVYLYALPVLAGAQAVTMWLDLNAPAPWVSIARLILK